MSTRTPSARSSAQLVLEAAAGLNPGDREVIELHLRHEMEAAEVAGVLGVSRNHAHTLLSRARGQLAACMGVLLVGRTGRDDCHELSDMLSDWDGHLTVLLRKRLNRHIRHCATCESRRAFAFSPAMILEGGAAMAAATLWRRPPPCGPRCCTWPPGRRPPRRRTGWRRRRRPGRSASTASPGRPTAPGARDTTGLAEVTAGPGDRGRGAGGRRRGRLCGVRAARRHPARRAVQRRPEAGPR